MMKIIKEVIAAGLLGPHMNHGVVTGRNDLLKMQSAAFKFRSARVEILDVDGYRPTKRSMKLGRLEFMPFHNKRQ